MSFPADLIKRIQDILNSFLNIQPDKIVQEHRYALRREKPVRDLHFILKRYLAASQLAKNAKLEILPRDLLEHLESCLSPSWQHFQPLLNLSLELSEDTSWVEEFVKQAEIKYPKFFEGVELAHKTVSLDQDISRLGRYLEKGNKMTDYLSEAENIQESLQKILESAQNTVGKIGIQSYSKSFMSEAKHYNRTSYYWLLSTILTIGALITIAIWDFTGTPRDIQGETNWTFIISRAILMSILFYAASFCIKGFKASQHNAILNRHRSIALNTFETFTNSTEDEETKNAVLLEATRTIFSNQNTGYQSHQEEGNTNHVIEIFKSVKPHSNTS